MVDDCGPETPSSSQCPVMDQPKVFLHPSIASNEDADEWPDLESESCNMWQVVENYTLKSDQGGTAVSTLTSPSRTRSGTSDLTDDKRRLCSESRMLGISGSLSQLSQGVGEPIGDSAHFSVPQLTHPANTIYTKQVSQ